MDFIFITITILWLLEFLIFPSMNKTEKDIGIGTKINSFRVILISIIFIITVNAIMYVSGTLLIKITWLKGIALFLYGAGLILRYWSLISLGQNFSREVNAKRDQQLVSSGTYRYVRHPLYLGLFLLTIAVPLYTGNIVMFLVGTIIMFKAISIRIIEEEKVMEDTIGERYTEWKKERYKFIPFLY